jgi:WD40 repeat protein
VSRLSSDTSGTRFLIETYPDRNNAVPVWHLLDASGRGTAISGSLPRPVPHIRLTELAASGALLSPDGRTVVALTRSDTLGVWTTDPFELHHTIPLPSEPSRSAGNPHSRGRQLPGLAAYTPDSRSLVVTSQDTAYVLDLADGARIATVQPHARRNITAFAVSSDGGRAAIGYDDGTVRVLSTRDWRAEPVSLDPHPGPVTSLAFDGNELLTSSTGGSELGIAGAGEVRIFDLADPAPATELLPISETAASTQVLSLGGGRVLVDGVGIVGAFEPVLWRIGAHTLVERACDAAGRDLTVTEWRRALPDRPQVPVCP